MKWHLHCARVAVATLLCLGVAAGAQAQQTWAGDGNGLYNSTTLEKYQLPDGRMVRTVSLAGFIVSDDKESPFHLASQDCSGTWVIEADGEAYSVAGHCVSRDAEGDVFWHWWSGDASGGEFGMTSGTGKFAGMEGGGTYTNLAQMPDGKIINAWHAEVTMHAGMTMK
jgi:hypothetical protein